jgi:superfamily II DNA helicase RecQ
VELVARLRALRRRLAQAQHVPAYIVFGDATLLEMAARKPADERELLEITGVGLHKLTRYGPAFLAAIAGEDPTE